MWDNLLRLNQSFSFEDLSFVVLPVFFLLSVFFHYSNRMNARLEAPAARRLPRGNVFTVIANKLKLLPNESAGRRSNFFLLLFTAWISADVHKWISNFRPISTLLALRGGFIAYEQAQLKPSGLWLMFLIGLPLWISLLSPLFLARHNREFYYDVAALFYLFYVATGKVLMCWQEGCCCGFPWPKGVYNHFVETRVFPVQLFESAAVLLAFFLCLLFMLYAKSYQPGRGAALCVLLFAVERFFWDFFHYKGEVYWAAEGKIGLFGLSMIQTLCVALSILAIAWWLWILPLEKKLFDRFWRFVDRCLRRRA